MKTKNEGIAGVPLLVLVFEMTEMIVGAMSGSRKLTSRCTNAV
jgi:hypothetical protein